MSGSQNNTLSGRVLAQRIKQELLEDIKKCLSSNPKLKKPTLSMVLVGNNYASRLYVEFKKKSCQELGINSQVIELKESLTQKELIDVIEGLNKNPEVDAILVQLPLPSHIDSLTALSSIDPRKDVDGLTPYNQGLLMAASHEAIVPCTPQGIVELIKQEEPNLEGKLVSVVGRSLLVGKSVRLLLENYNCTTIGVHSKTRGAKDLCKLADILVVAVGKIGLIDADWVKKDALVIDVGINRDMSNHTVGDVNVSSVMSKTSRISPVPGGVGPMTIIMLMKNCIRLWKNRSFVSNHN